MPVGPDKAIVYRDGFAREEDYRFLLPIFLASKMCLNNTEEMYNMNSNIFSISPEVVVSEQRFERLNLHLEQEWGLTVEKVPYFEISKMGGLLRCSTLPLIRE